VAAIMNETPDPASKPPRKVIPLKKRRGLTGALLLFAGCVATIILLLAIASAMMGAQPAMEATSSIIDRIRPFAILLQCAAIGCLWWYWANVIEWLIGKKRITPLEAVRLTAARTRVCVALAVIELVLVIGFPFRFI
jgi:hypothetical protein